MMDIQQQGLSQAEVEERIAKGKQNHITSTTTRSYKEIFRANIVTFFNLINLILFIFVLLTGSYRNGLFMGTILFNTCVGIIQEIHAKRIVDRLSILVMEDIDVKRDGTWQTIKMDQLVLEDLYRLKAGMQIPCDAKIEEGFVEVDESILTGESKRQSKNTGDNLLAGSFVTSGEAIVKSIHVGKDNFSETILRDGRTFKPQRTQMQLDTTRMLKIIAYLLIPIGILLFITHYFFLHLTWQQSILRMVSAVIGMIPEGLVVLISIALAVSTIRLSRRNVLVQNLYSIESLARVDTLCIDKTGTLTKGIMKVEEVVPMNEVSLDYINAIMGSYCKAFSEGNATSQAIKEYFKENEDYHCIHTLPFSSDRKYAAVTFEKEGTYYLGALSFLFPNGNEELEEKMEAYTKRGRRVVLVAHSKEEIHKEGILPSDLEALALISIGDVLRDHVQEIIRYFDEQEVTIKVISGDDPSTVSALAKEAGIKNAENYYDMSQPTNTDLASLLETHAVFGRVLPSQKKEMVQTLQKMGHSVAMVGDGVNDVPALRMANVGVAMASGSAAARNTSNMILLTNDFGEMPQIVKEGRRVINNISRASSMYLVKTVFSVLLSLYTILLREEYPFLPIHLTVLSMFGVAIPTFLLQMEPSFERVKGRFYERALSKAVPSAITVFLCAFICNQIQVLWSIPETHMNTIMLILTGYTYLYTLFRVYYPPDRYRVSIFLLMAIGFLLVLRFGGALLNTSFHMRYLWILAPGAILVPCSIFLLQLLFERIQTRLKRG